MVLQSQPVSVESAPGGVLSRRWLEILRTICARAFVPPPKIREWVESQRIPIKATHNRQAAKAGKCWEFKDFPVMADWVFEWLKEEESDVLFADGQTRRVRNRSAAVLKDAQSGLTSTMIHGVAWWVTWQSGNVIMVTATRDLARDGGKDKLDLLDQYPELKESKRDESTAMAVRYRDSIIWLGGGQNCGPFISNPASLVICDEPVKHSLVNGMIPMNMLEGRLKADDEGRMISFSTPDDELEFEKNPLTGTLQPKVTVETAIHSSFLAGTQERVEVPCPHCGHYQPLDWQRLQFAHCKVSLDGMDKLIWDHGRVARETWYQCSNPQCTDRHADGTVRGRIDEHHKRAMIERRRYVAQNLEYSDGHRTLQAGGMYNLAHKASTWGAIANAFLAAKKNGSDAAMKGFLTDVIGIPFPRFRARTDALLQIRKLKRGYRRLGYDGKPLRTIPLPHAEVRFVGMTADVQQDCIKWSIAAVAWDGQVYLLDWGRVAELDDLTAITETREFFSKDVTDEVWPVALVYIDVNYRRPKVLRFLAAQNMADGPRWEGISGRDVANDNEAKVETHWVKEYPVEDENGAPLMGWDATGQPAVIKVRVHNMNAEHWEDEWHIERVAKYGTERMTKPAVHFPSDTPDDFLDEACNAEQYHKKIKGSGIFELRWKKARADMPNDRADNLRAFLVMVEAVTAEEG